MSRLPGLKSPAFMLLEMSSATMMLRALLRIWRTSCGTCGRASATISSASATSRSASGSHGQRARRRGRGAGEEGEPRESRSARRAARRRPPHAQAEGRGHEQQQQIDGVSEPHRPLLAARVRASCHGPAARAHRRGRRPRVRRRAAPRELHQVRLVESAQRRRRPPSSRCGGRAQSSSVVVRSRAGSPRPPRGSRAARRPPRRTAPTSLPAPRPLDREALSRPGPAS